MNNVFIKLNNIVDPLVCWYEANRRDLPWRHNPTPYRVWISEIMLQQTRVDSVIPYYLRFMEELPDVVALAETPEDHLMKLWEGLGYYSRARNLQKAARIIAETGEFPSDFEGWFALPGIGEYTAGAICSIALGLPTPAVDGNVLRVISRILGSFDDITQPQVKKSFTAALKKVYPLGKTSEFTQALMELGAIVCLPNGEPRCDICPMKGLCTAFMESLIDEIPVKTPKKKRRIEEKTVFILRNNGRIAIVQRPASGLLANLWEYPNHPSHLEEQEVLELFKSQKPLSIKRLEDSVHIFTHIEWHMRGYELTVSSPDPSLNWMSIDRLLSEKAVPSAFRRYTDYIKNQRYEEI